MCALKKLRRLAGRMAIMSKHLGRRCLRPLRSAQPGRTQTNPARLLPFRAGPAPPHLRQPLQRQL